MTDSVASIAMPTSLGMDPRLDFLEAEPQAPETRERFLMLDLTPTESALLPLDNVTEVLRVKAQDVLPVPDMPSCISGICNWRGQMLWLVNFAQLLESHQHLNDQQQALVHSAVVITVDEQVLGLMVLQVNGIEYYAPDQIQPIDVGVFSPRLVPFVQGYLPSTGAAVLNAEAIAQCPLWQIYRS